MKQQRLRFKLLALVLFGMFLLLAVFGGYSVFTYGNRWFSSRWNPRVRSQKQSVIAGDILDRNGVILATTQDGKRIYQQDEASRRAIVHLLGDEQGQVSNGVETFQTSYLYGFQTSLGEMVSGLFSSDQRKGDSVTLTIDSRLCTAIPEYFAANEKTAGKRGAAVVMNYRTGEVIAMISLPNFDPHSITAETLADPGQPFWNRATQSVYAPGSSFKVITTVAAINHIEGVQSASIPCTGGLDVEGHAIRDWGNEIHGKLSLQKAFSVSCNNAYALLALDMGDEKLRKTAESFGFNDNFLFRDLVVENSVYPTSNRNQFEVAWSGAGQSAIVASPMHMCMVAAAIANDGVMMEPRLLMSVDSVTGQNRVGYEPRIYRTALTPENATILTGYMRSVVSSGTGSRARVSGVTVCGKTGSAESSLDRQDVTHGWFIGFIDDEDYPYAVSVLVESINDGDGGGSTAAPIAGKIFSYLVNEEVSP
ncbi:MAG: penicillin-binding protein 2 [Clostridia bacterium]|nr:penicillin-binding protein 2 [Clostridia bacterium]